MVQFAHLVCYVCNARVMLALPDRVAPPQGEVKVEHKTDGDHVARLEIQYRG